MCNGKDCPIKEKCYRFTAPKGIRQSYFLETPGKMEDGKFVCDKSLFEYKAQWQK
jgi:hypothetical protein